MSELISGKEAKLAWANGENIQIKPKVFNDGWLDSCENNTLGMFDDGSLDFRIKPKTITINGFEVPAPFEPKVDEEYYHLECGNFNGYAKRKLYVGNTLYIQFGVWRTEEEIKQVVEALRSVF